LACRLVGTVDATEHQQIKTTLREDTKKIKYQDEKNT